MKCQLTRDVTPPQRANPVDAGIDFFVPNYSLEFVEVLRSKNTGIRLVYPMAELKGDSSLPCLRLLPGERILIPSGVKVLVPEHHALIGFNKSGVSTKQGLDILAAVIDSGYQGEVHISLVNSSCQDVRINFGQKIVQYILIPIVCTSVQVTDNLYESESSRGTGGFGSTGA